jgi:hypothetical protein
MSKYIYIKLTRAGIKTGPFTISDQFGNVINDNVTREDLIKGINYNVDDSVDMITLESIGNCTSKKTINLSTLNPVQINKLEFIETRTGCLWRHLTNIEKYHHFYGNPEPYIIEYPFAYQGNDEILQCVRDYTKAYKYFMNDSGVLNFNDKIEINSGWFNKAIVYNGQQSSGILELVAKPIHNLKEYMKYPTYKNDRKIITFTKSDNFYQYNTFWDIVKDKHIPLFINSCESLSIDKMVNQSNMDYSSRSFNKAPIRAKDLKIRQILDSRCDIHLVSQFILHEGMVSYK